MVTGSDDTEVRSYDIYTGALRYEYKGHRHVVKAAKIMGNKIYSASFDKTLRVWDADLNLFDSDGVEQVTQTQCC